MASRGGVSSHSAMTSPTRLTQPYPKGPKENPVTSEFIHPLRHNRRLSISVVGLFLACLGFLVGSYGFSGA